MSGVDVVAVLRRHAVAERDRLGTTDNDTQAALAAVAELIEAADVLLHYRQPQEMPAAFEKLAVSLAGASGIAHCDAALARCIPS